MEVTAGTGPVRALCAPATGRTGELEAALVSAGLELTTDPGEADAVVWCSTRPDGLPALLAAAPRARWVQLPYAGVERFAHLAGDGRTWTCAKAVYGPAVAEFTLGLLLALFRRIDRYATATSWQPLPERTLRGAAVTILGAGGIAASLASLLGPLESEVTTVSLSARPVAGARSVGPDRRDEAVAGADAVVLAVPLTPATTGLVDAGFLASMQRSAVLVNVARGPVVVTDDLVAALRAGTLAGAALDVTDPEPLPDDHPLWSLPNALVTPHVANTPRLGTAVLARLVEENGRRFRSGQPLEGVLDPTAGY